MIRPKHIDLYCQSSGNRSEQYIKASLRDKQKAINKAVNTLQQTLLKELSELYELTDQDVFEQIEWQYKLGTAMKKSSGSHFITVDGTVIRTDCIQLSLSPDVANRHRIQLENSLTKNKNLNLKGGGARYECIK